MFWEQGGLFWAKLGAVDLASVYSGEHKTPEIIEIREYRYIQRRISQEISDERWSNHCIITPLALQVHTEARAGPLSPLSLLVPVPDTNSQLTPLGRVALSLLPRQHCPSRHSTHPMHAAQHGLLMATLPTSHVSKHESRLSGAAAKLGLFCERGYSGAEGSP